MAKVNSNSYRQKTAARLRNLSACLNRFRICPDLTALERAASNCGSNKPNGGNSWGYNIIKQSFRFPHDSQQVFPIGVEDLTLTMSCTIEGICLADESLDDPITRLEVSLDITGKSKEGSVFYSGYHFDKHISGAAGENPSLAHPDYHFHHGGHFLKGNLNNEGNMALLGSPRIGHPPLDGVLVIDFILSNFLGDKWKMLYSNGEYSNSVSDAQKVYWSPYFRSLASSWCANVVKGDVNPKLLWPQLV